MTSCSTRFLLTFQNKQTAKNIVNASVVFLALEVKLAKALQRAKFITLESMTVGKNITKYSIEKWIFFLRLENFK